MLIRGADAVTLYPPPKDNPPLPEAASAQLAVILFQIFGQWPSAN